MAGSLRHGKHFLALDALRGIAALIVTITHLGWTNSFSHTGIDRNGYLMVDFFFVLSGFVIALNYRDRIEDFPSAGRFVWLRFWRLYPLHFVMLFVFLAIEFAKYGIVREYGVIPLSPPFTSAPFALNDTKAFLSNLALVQAFGINADDTFNPAAWSISTEFYTYGVFALILLCFGRRRLTLVAATVVLASLAVFFYLGDGLTHSSDRIAEIRCLYGFFLGVIAHDIYRALSTPAPGGVPLYLSSRIPCLLLAAILAFLLFKPAQIYDLLMPLFSAALIISLSLAPRTFIARTLTSRPMVWLGAVSYSIYMVHMAILWFFDQFVHFALGGQPVTWPGEPDRQLLAIAPFLGDALAVLAFALVLFVAHFTYTWIEAPMRTWSRRRLDGTTVPESPISSKPAAG